MQPDSEGQVTQNFTATNRARRPENQAAITVGVAAPGRANGTAKANGAGKSNGHDDQPRGASPATAERLNGRDRGQGGGEKEGTPTGPDEGVESDAQAIADAPPAGRHVVRLLRVTLIHRSGDRGFELLLQSGAHLWRPRPLWFRSDLVPPAIVRRDLDNVLVPLLRAVAAPGALTEAEAAQAMIGLTFVATVDAAGAVVKAETSA